MTDVNAVQSFQDFEVLIPADRARLSQLAGISYPALEGVFKDEGLFAKLLEQPEAVEVWRAARQRHAADVAKAQLPVPPDADGDEKDEGGVFTKGKESAPTGEKVPTSEGTLTVLSRALDAMAEASFDVQVHALVTTVSTLRGLSVVEQDAEMKKTFDEIGGACVARLKDLFKPAT